MFQKYSSQSYPLLLFYLGVINVNIFRFILFVIFLSFSIYLLFAILFQPVSSFTSNLRSVFRRSVTILLLHVAFIYMQLHEWVTNNRILAFTQKFLGSLRGKHCKLLAGNVRLNAFSPLFYHKWIMIMLIRGKCKFLIEL